VEIGEFQRRLRATYEARDRARGRDATFMWLVEEVGELSRALRRGDAANLREEFSDALAWLVSVASLAGVDMEEAASRFAEGCPRCGRLPCGCPGDPRSRPARPAPRRKGRRRAADGGAAE
jgi:NTP pyrophosphatase (non-canonical NTP hydrolase)